MRCVVGVASIKRSFLFICVCLYAFTSCSLFQFSQRHNTISSVLGAYMQSEELPVVIDNRVVISHNKPLNVQLALSGTEYIIKSDLDLHGQIVYMPLNSVLRFEGGSVYNGTIIGNQTLVINERSALIFGPSFKAEGTWRASTAHSNWFYIDPSDATNAVTWLIERAMEGTEVTFDKNLYKVCLQYNDVSCYSGYRKSAFYAKAKCVNLNFNGATILDSTEIEPGVNVNFICLDNCSGTIDCLDFTSVYQSANEDGEFTDGKVVIHCINDCHDLSLKVSANHVRACVETGRFDWHIPSIRSSVINATLRHGGYGVALYDGTYLKLNVDADYAHRGAYVAGCVDSDIYVKCGKVSTGVACLIKDTRLLINNLQCYIQSTKLNVETYCYCYSGDTINNVQFSSYNIQDFAKRKIPYSSTINVKSTIRPACDAANVRIFNVYGANQLDSLKANISFNLEMPDGKDGSKEVLLYNNSLTSDLPCEFYTELSFTGKSSQPLTLRQEHSGEYSINLSDIEVCANNSCYNNGYINLYLGSRECLEHNNKLYISNCPVSYVRRSNSSMIYCFPEIYADSVSVVYISDKAISDIIKLNTTREITALNPYSASIFLKLNVELEGKTKVLSLRNPNGVYYWATKGQIFTVVFSNMSNIDDSKVVFDDSIITFTKEVNVPRSSVCTMDLIWTGEKFKIVKIY